MAAIMPSFVIPQNCVIPDKAIGVWQIPDLNISIPVYSANKSNEQKIIDDQNSAAQVKWCSAVDIGDHSDSLSSNGKGRWNMDKIRPSMVAFYVKKNGTYKYSCVLSAIADVKSWGYYVNGSMLYPRSSTDILNSCCVGSDSTRNYVSLFKYEGKLP